MTDQIRIIRIPAGEKPRVEHVTPTLEKFQELVGGWIEIVAVRRDGLEVCCNEEGKLQGLPLNFPIFSGNDIICGDAFLLRHDDEGEAASVTDADVDSVVNNWNGRL